MHIYDKNHPHNAVFCEHLQSVIDGKPKAAEYTVGGGVWRQLSMNKQGISLADWLVSYDYRIKPPEPVMITRNLRAELEAARAVLAQAEIGLANLGAYQSAPESPTIHEYGQAGRALTLVRGVLCNTKEQSK